MEIKFQVVKLQTASRWCVVSQGGAVMSGALALLPLRCIFNGKRSESAIDPPSKVSHSSNSGYHSPL